MIAQTTMTTEGAGRLPAFRKLLLATDFSPAAQAAFEVALRRARELNASLVLLHMVNPPAVESEGARLLLDLQSTVQKARLQLEGLRLRVQEAGIECEAQVLQELTSYGILDTIRARHIDLAVLGTRAPHGLDRLCFGSTAEAVLRHSPCPVLTVGPQAAAAAAETAPQGPVVFATDFNGTTIHAVRYAYALCEATHSSLHCVHVLPRTVESVPENRAVAQILKKALQHIADESGVTIPPPICATRYGSEISNAIVEYANGENARLVVLGVRQKSILAGRMMPGVTARIITEARCPVLTIGFSVHPVLGAVTSSIV